MLRGLWTQERFTFKGDFFRINDAWLLPRPLSKDVGQLGLRQSGATE
ncbi:hypothetical protein [Sorangium sp. So ce394]